MYRECIGNFKSNFKSDFKSDFLNFLVLLTYLNFIFSYLFTFVKVENISAILFRDLENYKIVLVRAVIFHILSGRKNGGKGPKSPRQNCFWVFKRLKYVKYLYIYKTYMKCCKRNHQLWLKKELTNVEFLSLEHGLNVVNIDE